MAENFGNILGQFALSNNPTLMTQRRPGLAGLIGDMISKGKDDPSKQALAQYAPTTLNNPNPMDIIGGALGKAAMPQAKSRFSLAPELQAPDVDMSNLGNFGDVNSTAHATEMGQKADAGKPGFWDSKGGNILGSLLGIIGLGTLGAGIGAISGGGRGALRGASYGMGFGALQDISLRKQAMEAPANQIKSALELEKIQQSAISPEIKFAQQYQNLDPSMAGQPLNQASVDKALLAKNPYAAQGIALRKEGLDVSKAHLGLAQDALDSKNAERVNKLQDDADNLAKIESGMKNITEALKVPYAERASWMIPGASKVSVGAADFEQNNALILSNFARFSGEKGVLTDQDIKRVLGALFSPMDTEKVIATKKKTLDDLFSQVKTRISKKQDVYKGGSAPSAGASPAAAPKRGGYAPYSRPVNEMSQDEIDAEIQALQSGQ